MKNEITNEQEKKLLKAIFKGKDEKEIENEKHLTDINVGNIGEA